MILYLVVFKTHLIPVMLLKLEFFFMAESDTELANIVDSFVNWAAIILLATFIRVTSYI